MFSLCHGKSSLIDSGDAVGEDGVHLEHRQVALAAVQIGHVDGGSPERLPDR